MNRSVAIAIAMLLVGACPCPAQEKAKPARRPNILWIVAENIDLDLGCYGAKHVHTPNIDRLAREGMRFTRVFATAPVCAPSRSAFMTGMYQTTTDTHHMRSHRNDDFRLPPGVRPLTHWLQDAGYATFNIGMILRWLVGTVKLDLNFVNEGKIFQSDRWADLKKKLPFFAMINTPEVEYDIYDRKTKSKPRVEWVGEREHPQIAKPDEVTPPPYFPDHPIAREEWARYLNSVSGLDVRVGKILDALKRDGLEEDTIVVFFADNGRLDVRGIHWCYDSGLRVPLIVRWPRNFPAPANCRSGTVNEQVVSLLDLTATTLDMAGLKRPPGMQSRILWGPNADPPRKYAFSARDRIDETVNRIRSVRDARYRYNRNFMPEQSLVALNRYREKCFLVMPLARKLHAEGKLKGPALSLVAPRLPEEELFDTKTDPFEVKNLAQSSEPAHREALLRLRTALEVWITETGDRGRFSEPPEVVAPFEKEMDDWFGTPAWYRKAPPVPTEQKKAGELAPNTFTLLRKDNVGARRGGAVRYAASERKFLLWGFMDADPEFLQENPAMPLPEHDVVFFDIAGKRWRDHVSKAWAEQQAKQKPLYFVPRCYHGLTSGSERSLFRAPAGYPPETARPDLNISFDQVVYHPPSRALIYFTGGLTASYHVETRRWTKLAPAQAPPPVLGGSLAYNPVHNELVLFGGGHVAEKRADGRLVGDAGTWLYSFATKTWRRHPAMLQPPPRMYSRLVCDTRNQVLVLFGGDRQSHYLADTWIFDLKTRTWREAKVPGPAPRAGHFTVYDPDTGWVIVGGGFNRNDLDDLWAFDAAKQTWQGLKGKVPTAAYINADFDPEKRFILLTANERAPGHGRSCDVLYAARSTFGYRLDAKTALRPGEPVKHGPVPKRAAGESGQDFKADPARVRVQEERLRKLPVNQWVALADPLRIAPVRTWGSATYDARRGRIELWGGGHCGYGGSDVDSYDLANHTWIGSAEHPEYPHRLWARGVRLAGVTFGGNPWTEHGRRIYAHDPSSGKMIAVRGVLLTTGYLPDALRAFPGVPRARVDAKVKPPTAYRKYVTWAFDPDSGRWDVLCPAPMGLDTLVTTTHGVMGVNVDWPERLKDSGYMLPFHPEAAAVDNAVFHFDAKKPGWKRLGAPQASPQNLYEMTSLAHDSKRDRLLLHGGGTKRDELWAFDLKSARWQHLKPRVAAPAGAEPPTCNREAVYLPAQDVLLTFGPAPGKEVGPALWAYRGKENAWYRIDIASPPGVDPRIARGQNRALVYDPHRDLVLLVLGANDRSQSLVFALRYRHEPSNFKK